MLYDVILPEPSMLWQPLVTKTNSNTSNKSLSRISSRDHKRTQQGVSAELLSYLYKLHMVCATNNYFCPNIHMSSMSAPYEIAVIRRKCGQTLVGLGLAGHR